MQRTRATRGPGRPWRGGRGRLGTISAGFVAACAILVSGCATLGLGHRPAPLRVSQIVKMSQEHVPANVILEKMRQSGTVYRLTAAQIVELHREGLPDPVLDYMQKTYVACVRSRQRLQDYEMWSFGDDGYWYGGLPYGWPGGWVVYPDSDRD